MKKYTISAFCAPCTLGTVYKTIELSTQNEKLKFEIMKKVLEVLKEEFNEKSNPTFLANKIFPIISKMSGNIDPYKQIKQKGNEIARSVVLEIKPHVLDVRSFRERVRRGIAAAITGNIIDYGNVFHKVNYDELSQSYYKILETGFMIDHTERLLKLIDKSKQIIYFADNAGEIFFDKLFLEVLKERINNIFFVVKGGPIINDATIDDAKIAKINDVAEVITTGTAKLGIDLRDISEEVKQLLDTADIAIFKGQANFETVIFQSESIKIPKVNIFRAKCRPIARYLQVPLGSNIVFIH